MLSDGGKKGLGSNAWPPFVDILMTTVILLLFVILAQYLLNPEVIVQNEIRRRMNEMEEIVQARLHQSFGPEIVKQVSFPERSSERQRIQLGESILFVAGEADLSPQGARVIDSLGVYFAENQHRFTRILVEGHADMRRLNYGPYRDNWGLSSARATTVVRRLDPNFSTSLTIDEVPNIDPANLQAIGRSWYAPAREGEFEGSEAVFQRNRRIEFILLYDPRDIKQQLMGAAQSASESNGETAQAGE